MASTSGNTSAGNRKIIRNTTVPVWSEEGRLDGEVVLNEDITELKQVEEELRRLNSKLEERVNERTLELAELQRRRMDSAESISGNLQVESGPGRRTRLRVTVPRQRD